MSSLSVGSLRRLSRGLPRSRNPSCAQRHRFAAPVERINSTWTGIGARNDGSGRASNYSTSPDVGAIDVLIVGGGPIGSSTAYHLAKSRNCDGRGIVVIERDPTYSRASATLSAGGIRQQFSLRENVQMSLYGRHFLRNADELLRTSSDEEVDVQFREHGYLFLADSEGAREAMIRNNTIQREVGCDDVEILDPSQLGAKFPWMNTSDVLTGSYGAKGEGWFDPWALISALRSKNLEMGVTYIHGFPVGAKRDGSSGRVLSVDVKQVGNSTSSGTCVTYNMDHVVNAAGAHASMLMELLAGPDRPLQYPLPVRPRKRCIFFFHCSASEGVPPVAPLTVDASLCYFRSEGSGENGNFLCGVSPTKEDDRDCYDEESLDHADHHLFDERIWPAIFHRVPAFGEVKVKSSWAGLYDYNTLDQNAIIGRHPEIGNVLMVNGFSGHGLQHSPAAGRAAAELLDGGKFSCLDLSIFGFDRIVEGVPVFEQGIV